MQQTRKHFNQAEIAKYPSPATKNVWLPRFPVSLQRENTARARVIVFSHAGGNTAAYRPWDSLLSSDFSLLAVELPGRLTRFKDTPLCDVAEIAKQVVEQALVSYLDRPFFVFGHSFGSIVAFEVVRYIQKNFNLSPLALFISSAQSPLQTRKLIYTLPDDELIDHLIVTFKDAQLEKVKNEYPDLLTLVTPIIRADIHYSY